MDATISDDAQGAPGSGADRLYAMEGARFSAEVIATNVCESDDPPPECGMECDSQTPCPSGFVCSDAFECIGICDEAPTPPAVMDLEVVPDEREQESHHYATLRFTAPEFDRPVTSYEVRVSTQPMDLTDPDAFVRGIPARRAVLAEEALSVCDPDCPDDGEEVSLGLGHLLPDTTHYVAIRAISCGQDGTIAVAQVTTTEQNFTTVSPCFVATAAYGSPLADEIGVFRRFRDRHLMTNELGRALVDAYYDYGPHAAEVVEANPAMAWIARAVLTPLAALMHNDEP